MRIASAAVRMAMPPNFTSNRFMDFLLFSSSIKHALKNSRRPGDTGWPLTVILSLHWDLLGGHRQQHEEGRAFAGGALHPDFAVHHVDQAPRNRQPQARPLELARGGIVNLMKFVEDPGLLIGRDANARIVHADQHPGALELAEVNGRVGQFGPVADDVAVDRDRQIYLDEYSRLPGSTHLRLVSSGRGGCG